MAYDPIAILKESGGAKDSGINLVELALALAAPEHDGISIDRYRQHVAKIARDVGERHTELMEAGAQDNVQTQLAALKHILSDQEGYAGDEETYNDLQNADLMRVIDRRKGMPIALCILYIQAGRMNGWMMEGLNFPGHFLCRIEKGGERVIFDPFHACKVMEASDLRSLIKNVRGPNAELSVSYYEPCSNRETIIRLQNNIKLRLIEGEDYAGALESVERMRMLAPDEYRLLLDAGVLYAKTGKKTAAADVLEKYIEVAPDPLDRRDAELILRELEHDGV